MAGKAPNFLKSSHILDENIYFDKCANQKFHYCIRERKMYSLFFNRYNMIRNRASQLKRLCMYLKLYTKYLIQRFYEAYSIAYVFDSKKESFGATEA